MKWADHLEYNADDGTLRWAVKRPGPKGGTGLEVGCVKSEFTKGA